MNGRADARLAQDLPFPLDRPAPVVGMVLLATDLTTERDVRALMPDWVGVHATRIAFQNPTTPANLRQTLPHLGHAAELLVPGVPLAAIYYACTAATVTLGHAAIEDAVHATRPDVPVISPISAARNALTALDANDISILTPYIRETADAVVANFTEVGYQVKSTLALEMEDDREMARLDRQAIIEAAVAATHADARALFISCTALPAATLVPEIEARIGRPVITSNLAGLWTAARLAGYRMPFEGRGELMRLPMTERVA